MRLRGFLIGVLGLILVLGVVYAIPATRYPMLSYLGLERLHHGRPIAYWIGELKATSATERRLAALCLGDAANEKPTPDEAESQAAIAALVETLGDADGFVRKCAATSLLLYPRESAVPTDAASIKILTTALSDREAAVRQAAVRALWQAGPAAKQAEGVPRTVAALADKDDFVRAYATRVLAKIGPDARDAVPALVNVLNNDEDQDVRKLAGKALGLIGPEALGASRAEAIAGLEKGLLKGEKDEYREYCARALGQLNAVEAIPALQRAAKDRDADVRAAAGQALKKLQSIWTP